jgi:hypothetical protein
MGTIEEIRKAVHDVVAPELRATTASIESLEQQTTLRFNALAATIDAFRAEMHAEFASLRSR